MHEAVNMEFLLDIKYSGNDLREWRGSRVRELGQANRYILNRPDGLHKDSHQYIYIPHQTLFTQQTIKKHTMVSLSIRTVFLLLVASLSDTMFALPAGGETIKLNTARNRLSELPKDTLYKYKYFDLGRSRPQPLDAVVLLDSVVCDLTAKSPLTDDATKALDLLNAAPEGSLCCQTSIVGPRCTGLETKGSAVLSLCGGYQRCLYCADVADFLLLVIDNCQEGDRVGGNLKLAEISSSPEGGHIVVSHA